MGDGGGGGGVVGIEAKGEGGSGLFERSLRRFSDGHVEPQPIRSCFRGRRLLGEDKDVIIE